MGTCRCRGSSWNSRIKMIPKELLENFWILKSDDPKKFYQLKKELKQAQGFINNQIGWKVIANDNLLKIEKTPHHAFGHMGINAFSEVDDYLIFVATLIYLEDKQNHEQFLLSQYIEALEVILIDYLKLDWTSYSTRRCLIRVLDYCLAQRLLKITDGSLEGFKSGESAEVLYENTGLCQYYPVSFNVDVTRIQGLNDLETPLGESTDQLRNAIYRQLITSPAITWRTSEDPYGKYLKNQRFNIQKNIDRYLSGELMIFKNSAYLMVASDDKYGMVHPSAKAISALVLFVQKQVVASYHLNELTLRPEDVIVMSDDQFAKLVTGVYNQVLPGLSSEYRKMDIANVVKAVTEYMEDFQLIKQEAKQIIIQGAVARHEGSYPYDFVEA